MKFSNTLISTFDLQTAVFLLHCSIGGRFNITLTQTLQDRFLFFRPVLLKRPCLL